MLRDFWAPFQRQIADAGKISVREVIDELDALLGPYLFPGKVDHGCDSIEGLYRHSFLFLLLIEQL